MISSSVVWGEEEEEDDEEEEERELRIEDEEGEGCRPRTGVIGVSRLGAAEGWVERRERSWNKGASGGLCRRGRGGGWEEEEEEEEEGGGPGSVPTRRVVVVVFVVVGGRVGGRGLCRRVVGAVVWVWGLSVREMGRGEGGGRRREERRRRGRRREDMGWGEKSKIKRGRKEGEIELWKGEKSKGGVQMKEHSTCARRLTSPNNST